ncbi:hypothetical protein [Acinetobacter sp.]|uniref:hypothetical protein n=1 Tax=Acinetobacter sp. TaxID=472 RepID=UPI000C0AF2F7|nr:hypothetical protein [Acinetobacter sp.]MAK31676.1 hypothetical protein [Acinetobacter sp.]QDP47189.1 MAG: hypothetical protein GOVbin655_23 [Prokaryotic dsDNA virus sp.]|tara:strand:- start:2174 stop:2515 length:342 start_codon:yes stop_codon:yes gene_type:complete
MASKGSLTKYSTQEAQNVALGQAGSIFVSGGNEVTCKDGVFVAITFLENTVFATDGLTAEELQKYPSDTGTGTDISSANGAAIDGEQFPVGVTIYGRWTSFKLLSGLVIAYRG